MKRIRFLSLFLITALMLGSVAAPQAAALEDPEIQAKAALLVDVETNAVAYAKGEHDRLFPASLTKIMTALLVFDAVEDGKFTLDQGITVTESALKGHAGDGSFAAFRIGEIFTVRDLLYFLLVVSSNEAAGVLAEAVSGSAENFVADMNRKALALGCTNTNFVNATGLHDENHYTSAWDLYLMTQAAMEYPEFMVICDTLNPTIPATNKYDKPRSFWTTNHLISNWRVIGYRNSKAHGIKDGSTTEAGYCLVSSSQQDDLHFVSVILGAERIVEEGRANILSYSETTRLLDYGFDNFTYKTILKAKDPIQEIPVTLSKTDYVTVQPAHNVEVLFPKELDPEDLEREIDVVESVEAPVSAGDKLGTITLSYGGVEYATVDLLAANTVLTDEFLLFLRDARAFLASPTLRITVIVLAALILLLVIWKLFFARRRYRYGRNVSRNRGNYRGPRRR